MRTSAGLTCLVMVLALCVPVPSLAEDWAVIDIGTTVVRWGVRGDFDQVTLVVSLPNGKVVRQEVKGGEPVAFDIGDTARDGVYQYELRGKPRLDDSVLKELQAARKAGTEFDVIESLRESGRLPPEAVQSGAFAVKDRVLVSPAPREDQDAAPKAAATPREKAGSQKAGEGIGIITAKDQVIPDDLIVQGSACIGFDCVNNEDFSFDTIRLKEHNLRIKFEDTSVGSFPTNDWQLTANDSASGGASRFSIEDITGSKVPFTITAGASTNSIFVDSTGRVGFRTATPVLDLHVHTSNTPAIRLEQNNSGGFTAQTWDIAGNEANFFVRDVTGNSRLPFRIRPGAPTSSIDIRANGNVGVGTASATSKLHVVGADATTSTVMTLSNSGDVRMNYVDTSLNATWGVNVIGGNLRMVKAGSGLPFAMQLEGNGTMTVVNLIESSDRDMKKDIVAVRPDEILEKVSRLPLATWRFKHDAGQATHLGPMAQDFSALFGLGLDDKHIKPLDVAGVSLAAVQALNRKVTEKDAEIAALKQQNGDLEKRLADLEALVSSLAEAQK